PGAKAIQVEARWREAPAQEKNRPLRSCPTTVHRHWAGVDGSETYCKFASLADHDIVAVPFPGSWLTTNSPANGFTTFALLVRLRCESWVFGVTPLHWTVQDTVASTSGPCIKSLRVLP